MPHDRRRRVLIRSILAFTCIGRALGALAAAPATLQTPTTRASSVTGGPSSQRSITDPFPPSSPQNVVTVTAKVFPAVVRIDVAAETFFEGKRDLRRGIGSGVIIDDRGHVLTNYHVAGRAAEIFVTLANKERIAAKLIGDDHWTDLAIVQLDMDEVKRKHTSFSFAQLGDSKDLVPGQPVMAIGTPFGFARTLTLGVVSNNERTLYPDRLEIDGYETGDFANWIQMDTPINPGNSGGPLVDMTGKVVGINTRGGGQNLNFAIPVDTAKEVAAKLLKSAAPDKKGRVERSDLGIDYKPMQDLESFYDIDVNKGVLVNSVEQGSPAQAAGVKPQDVLLSVNGHVINVRFPEELAPMRKAIADLPIGSTVELAVRRGKETLRLTTKTERLQGAIGEEKEFKDWGLSVREVTRKYATEKQLDSSEGVAVTGLSPGYPAAKAELEQSDVILSVNQQPVKDLDAFQKLYNESTKRKAPLVLLEIVRNRGRQSKVMKLSYDTAPSDSP
jgi:serine protease Do